MQHSGAKTDRRDRRVLLLALLVITATSGLAIGLFGAGYRYGLYNDDYSHKLWAYDLVTGSWRPTLELEQPHFRPLGQIVVTNLANALPDVEFPVRLLWAVVHLANVFLAALLAYRLVRSSLLALMVGGFFLFPFQAHEALFWHSGAAGAPLGTLVALGAVHLLLSAMERDTGWAVPTIFGLALVGLIPQLYEQTATALVCLPFFALFVRPRSRNRTTLRLLGILTVAAFLLAAHWFLVMQHSAAFDIRGGFQPSLYSLVAEGFPRLFRALSWAIFGRYELAGFASAWYLGWESLSDPIVLLALLALLGVAATAVLLLASKQEGEGSPSTKRYLWFVGVGSLWFGTAFLPLLVIKGHGIESRVLYFPWVGLSFALAGVVALLITRLPSRLRNIILMFGGLVFLFQVAALAGFGQVYRLRSAYDQKQLAAFTRAVRRLPEGDFFLVPFDTEERPVSTGLPGHDPLDWWLMGVFENPWSAGSALAMRYGRHGIVPVTSSRWDSLTIDGVEWQDGEPYLLVKGQALPPDRCLVFTYRDGEVILYDSVLVERGDHSQERVVLPLARQVGTSQTQFRQITTGPGDNG
jgi:hypothetical protein